jgi:UDP-glucose 6-dehydrogenase
MKVAVVGLGDVGTVAAACMASNGQDVWGVDLDAAKVDEIWALARWQSRVSLGPAGLPDPRA